MGQRKRATAEWGRIHQAARRIPDKAGIASFGSRRDLSSLSLPSPPAEGSSACVCCVSRRRLPRDRRRIVAAKFIPLTHPPWANARAKGLYPPSFSPSSGRVTKSALRYYAARGSPAHPVYARPTASFVLRATAPRSLRRRVPQPAVFSLFVFVFFFFTRKLPPSRKFSRYRKRRTFIACTIVNAL